MGILVTGAAGFVGSNTIKQLVEEGKPVRAMVRDAEKARRRLAGVEDSIEIVIGDVRDTASLDAAMTGITTVVHLVAVALEKRGQTYDLINYQGTVNVVDAARRAGVSRFVYMSQNGANSALPYPFLRSKGRAEDYVAEYAPRWTTLRPSSIFGTQDEFFNAIARMVRLTPLVFPLIGMGKATFQPVSVHNVAQSVVRALDDDNTIGRKLGLGGPEVLTLGEIERRIFKAMEVRRLLFPAPVWLLRVPVFIMERLLPGSPVTSGLLDLLALPNVVEENALTEDFGIEPTPFRDEHIDYLKHNTLRVAIKTILKGEAVN